MKKIIFILILLVLISGATLAFEDCPYDETDCAFPGECSRYVDADDDGICDLSQPASEDRSDDMAAIVTEDTTTAKDDTITATGDAAAAADDTVITAEDTAIAVTESDSSDQIPETAVGTDKQSKITYHLLLIFLVSIILYAITYILAKKKIIRVASHRKIWNGLLLITFLISGILGILLVIEISFGVAITLPLNILFWHVEVGIAMFIISLFHTFWHWTYFKKLFKFK